MGQQQKLCCLEAVFRGSKTSPVCSLQVEAGEMSLELRRRQLRVNYWIYLKGHGQNHQTKRVLGNSWEREREEKTSFGWTGKAAARELVVHGVEFCPAVKWPITPVWVLENSVVDIELLQVKASRAEKIW